MQTRSRQEELERADSEVFDVTIIGGGINGACLYYTLTARGYKVLLVDKGDFACGTSQASAMMIWGGLLYLTNLEVGLVHELCLAREEFVRSLASTVAVQPFRYLPPSRAGMPLKLFVMSGLYFYWLLGEGKRRRPYFQDRFGELAFLRESYDKGSLVYEEAVLRSSDSQFVMQWIAGAPGDRSAAINYCGVVGGEYSPKDHAWFLDTEDSRTGIAHRVCSRCVVNCAGVWTDRINQEFGIRSPYKHVFSKGVFIGVPRLPNHDCPLIVEVENDGRDHMSLIPWGPVSLWGPTDTLTDDLEAGFYVAPEDVSILRHEFEKNFSCRIKSEDILSMRCGIRPLAVPADFNRKRHPVSLSKRNESHRDDERPWVSTYGGKLTSCTHMARKILFDVESLVAPPAAPEPWSPPVTRPAECFDTQMPTLQERFPTPAWCRDHEYCYTIEDYLRRRTNIAQWLPKGGLGKDEENLALLMKLALSIHNGDVKAAVRDVERYRKKSDHG